MRPGGGLQVILRVEVTVDEDDRIGRHQVQSHATSLGAEQEEESVVIGVEVLHGQVSLLASHRPVQSLVRKALTYVQLHHYR